MLELERPGVAQNAGAHEPLGAQEPDAHRVHEHVVAVGVVEDGLPADGGDADAVAVVADARDGAVDMLVAAQAELPDHFQPMAFLVGHCWRAELGQQVAQELYLAGSDVQFVQADVSIATEVERLVSSTVRAHGRLDAAFNNAATTDGALAWAGLLGAVELSLFSVALMVGINEALYGGPTPYSADVAGETATDASFPVGYLERVYRLVALFIDREYGLLRWAPVFALVFAGLWWLWRSLRDRLARAVPGVREIEVAAGLCAAALGAQLIVAFLAPTMFGFWFPPRHLLASLPLAVPLVAWGLRHAPRVGIALSFITLAASVWLYVDVRWAGGSFVTERPDAPFGPLENAFPLFGPGGGWGYWLAGAIGLALAALAVREVRHSRQTAGATRARYSG